MRDVHTVTEDTQLPQAIDMMERFHVKRLPVVRGSKVVGIVTRANFLHALASVAHETKAGALDDTGIRENVLAELSKNDWVMPSLLNIVVRDGVVHLWGSISDDRTRGAIIVAARKTCPV